jgi:hypothetical protein
MKLVSIMIALLIGAVSFAQEGGAAPGSAETSTTVAPKKMEKKASKKMEKKASKKKSKKADKADMNK